MDMNTRRALVAGLGVATLGGLVGRRAAAEPEHARHGGTRAAALPNIPLVTHEGKAVTFYDDLIRGKVVAINMMYAECEGICPLATSNLVRVQELLSERVGRDVFLYSLTLQPELDTPQRLQEYAAMHGVKPGWLFLTGARADIERLRYRLGFFDPNPVVDGDKATHTGMVRIGNDGYDRWTSASSLALPEQIVATINHVDRSRRHRDGSYKG
jgi:protein SCO1/2